MSFLHPFLLILLPLAAAPVIVHLFFKLRRKTQRFSSLMFFLRIDPHAQSRRRIREWLLLALRMLLLLAAILALARPQLTGIGSGGTGAVVLLIDTSASMGSPSGDGRPKIALARDAAAALIEALGAGDTAAVLPTVADPLHPVRAGLTGDRTALTTALAALVPTEAASDVPAAVARAVAMLAESPTARRELHVFTDAQEGEWNQPGTLPGGIRVVVERLASAPRGGPDVAIRAVQPPIHRVLVGRPVRSGVVLVNHGSAAAAVDLRITEADGQERLLQATVPAAGETTVGVILTPAAPGACTALLTLTGDAFAGDNRGALALVATPRLAALLIGETGLLATALSPEGDGSHSGLVPMTATWAALPALLARKPAALVVTWGGLDPAQSDAVQAWVQAGGRLLVVPAPAGEVARPAAWPWLQVALAEVRNDPAGQPVVRLDDSAQAWAELRGQKVGEVRARRWQPLQLTGTGARIALGLADGTPLLAERDLGRGMIAVSGLAFHPGWSDLPLKGWSLAVIHALALPPADDAAVIRLTAGQPFAPSTAEQEVSVRAGGAVVWHGPRRLLPALPFAGVYRLVDALGEIPVAVTAAAGEGSERFVTGERLPALGDQPQAMIDLHSPMQAALAWTDARSGTDLTGWCIALALAALAAEGWLATATSASVADRRRAAAMPAPAVLVWLPLGPPVVLAAIALLSALALWQWYRRLRVRLAPAAAWRHLLPRALAVLLLVSVLLGPTLRFERDAGIGGTVIALVDTSGSMALADDGHTARQQRAVALIDKLRAALPGSVELRTIGFDTRLQPAALPAPAAGRVGDPAAVLRGLGGEPAVRGALAVVAFTDGGDEPLISGVAPPVPLSIVGIGTDPGAWCNLAVTDISAPATAEVGLELSLTATIENHTPATNVAVLLERQVGATWEKIDEQPADVRAGRAQVTFRRRHDQAGLVHYRVRVPPVAGEIATSDNQREAAIDVRAQTLHVLFFSREVGADYKSLRQELARDPGLTFTGLLRATVGADGERYLLQGDRLDGDAVLANGLPTTPAALQRYGVIVIGAFAPGAWRPGEQEALVGWVRQGGTLVLLGGDGAYPPGPLAALYPFAGSAPFVRGSFPVAISAAAHPILAGLTLPPGATIDSRNRFAAPSPGAIVLLSVTDGGGSAPLALIQPAGSGTVLALGTNTLWRLARPGSESFFGGFWRQTVRQQAAGDRERRVRVAWDRERYRPGDTAVATITALEPGLAISAHLRAPGAPTAGAVVLDAQGLARLDLLERGEWEFTLTVGSDIIYRKTLPVAPGLGEGERLSVDDAGLRALAEAGGGTYAREGQAASVFQALADRLIAKAERVERGLLDGWWTAVLLTILVLTEWIMRRRRNWL